MQVTLIERILDVGWIFAITLDPTSEKRAYKVAILEGNKKISFHRAHDLNVAVEIACKKALGENY